VGAAPSPIFSPVFNYPTDSQESDKGPSQLPPWAASQARPQDYGSIPIPETADFQKKKEPDDLMSSVCCLIL
jgi:hypothetical protein